MYVLSPRFAKRGDPQQQEARPSLGGREMARGHSCVLTPSAPQQQCWNGLSEVALWWQAASEKAQQLPAFRDRKGGMDVDMGCVVM